ncbi:hypothetical protein GCM10018785_03110 [Streptomyces longispororuber]|uniref:Uncharacterized protein n=1 Tax=Streptomyces longispororuber TaxID=68230 RepID=A0A918Z5D4_9ACTN|nr:hypothetical protein GCM10018785_03110 [Streptomyces longispororuber]
MLPGSARPARARSAFPPLPGGAVSRPPTRAARLCLPGPDAERFPAVVSFPLWAIVPLGGTGGHSAQVPSNRSASPRPAQVALEHPLHTR